jgi:hypothetical protein
LFSDIKALKGLYTKKPAEFHQLHRLFYKIEIDKDLNLSKQFSTLPKIHQIFTRNGQVLLPFVQSQYYTIVPFANIVASNLLKALEK